MNVRWHYDGEPERRPTYQRLIAEGLPGGYAADDGVALRFCGTDLVEAGSSRPETGAYHPFLPWRLTFSVKRYTMPW